MLRRTVSSGLVHRGSAPETRTERGEAGHQLSPIGAGRAVRARKVYVRYDPVDVPDFVLLRPASDKWFDRGPGIRSFALVNKAIGGHAFLSGITELEPGAAVPVHYHNCEESVTILEGVGTVERSGEGTELRPFDTTWIAANVTHQFVNRGHAKLTILWTYGTTAATRTLVATGIEIEIGDSKDVYRDKE